jgi:hypothetical protein
MVATRFSPIVFVLALALSATSVLAQENATTTVPTSSVQADRSWLSVEQLSREVVGDFVVGPGRSEIQLQPGQSYVQEIVVTNRISDNRRFNLEVEDITGSIDGSSAVTLTGEAVGPYSIRDYISFPADSFVLDLGERARVPVTITVPPNAEPGGFYGSVLVSTISEDNPSALDSAPRTPIIARVGSLFFVTVAGEQFREGETVGVTTVGDDLFYQSGPIELAILFENTGSVHTNPYGELSITNMFGEEVGFVELEPWFVLPQSLRSREITWDREFLLGRYTVTARVNRGYDDIVDEVSTTFWVVPYTLVGIVFAVLFFCILVIRFFAKNFEFKRKTPINNSSE